MRDWVIPFLRDTRSDRKTVSQESFEEELRTPVFCFRRLASYFNINFSENTRLIEIFGSVLASLPEETFFHLLETKNLFFLFIDKLGLVQRINFLVDRPGIICAFSERPNKLSDMLVRAIIAHEINHITLAHYDLHLEFKTMLEKENEADREAVRWGFQYEISLIRDFLKFDSPI